MALFKKKKNEEEETRKASSSGGSTPRVIEAAKNLYQQVSAAQQRAVQANMAVQQAQTQRLQEAARGLYSAYQQGQQQLAQTRLAQDQAAMQRQQRVQTAARNLYQQAQQQQQRAVQADMAVQQAGTQRAREAAQGLYSAFLQGQEQQARAQVERDQAAIQRQQRMQGALQNLYQQAAQRSAQRPSSYNGEYLQGVLGKVGERQSSLTGGDPTRGVGSYAELMGRDDFAANAGAGESRRGWGFNTDPRYDYINNIGDARETLDYQMRTGQGGDYAKYALMNDDEVGVYNYLYATEGRDSADAFLAQLEPELNAQWYSGASANNAEEATKNGWNAALYSAATVAGQPVRTMTSVLADAEDAIRTATGQGIDPYSDLRMASRMTADTREAVSEDIRQAAGKWGGAASFAYQTAMSAGDSFVNAMMAQGLGEAYAGLKGLDIKSEAGLKALKEAVNVIGSVTMSSEVMSLGTAESKEKGYSDLGALSLGFIRGGIEYLSEKLGGDWILRTVKKSPKSLIYSMAKAMVPEGVEEIMSDVGNEAVNALIDHLFGLGEDGEGESYIGNAYRYFKAQGAENPWQNVAWLVLQKEGLSFLGGAFAAFGSGASQYRSNQLQMRQIAADLHTDTDTVAQIMTELDTDEPGKIDFLAKAYGADNVEQLRERIGETKTAEAAIDEVMRERGAAENEERGVGDAAPYDNGLAGNDNAPRERSALDVDTEGVLNNGEQSLDRGSEVGNDTLGTGGESLRNEAGAQRGEVDAGDEVGQRRDRVSHYGVKEEVTPASLGITNGSTTQRVQVLDEATFEAGSPEAQAAQRARQMGLDPVFVRSTMEVGGKQVRGYIQGSRVILQADGKYSADQILQHEEYHDASRRNPQLNRTVREALANNLTEQELGDLVGRYITAYDGVYDFSGMTQAEIEALIEEELFADLYAGIDNTGRETLREDARRGYAQAQTEQGQQTEQERDTTGPPEGEREGAPREEQPGKPQYIVLDHNDTTQIEQKLADAYDKAVDENRGVTIDPKTLAKYSTISRDPEQKLIDAVSDYYEHALKGTTVDVKIENGIMTIMFENDGKRKSVGWRMKADKAATFESLRELTENAVYAYSEENRDANERTSIPLFHYFVNNVSLGGKDIPVKIQTRDIITGENPGTHYYTHTLVKNKASTAGPVSGTDSSRIDSNAISGSRTDSIRDSEEKSNPQNGRGSVEVPGADPNQERRDAARKAFDAAVKDLQAEGSYDNYDYWQAENKYFSELAKISGTGNNLLQELVEAEEQYHQANEGNNTEYDYSGELDWINTLRERVAAVYNASGQSQNTSAAENGTNAGKNAQNGGENAQTQKNVTAGDGTSADPRRELRKAEQEYMDASNRSDPDYDYEGQLAKIKALREQVEEGETAPSSAEQSETKEAGGASSAPTEARKDNNYDSHPERGEIGKDGVRVCRDTEALEAEINEIGGAKLKNDTGEYFARVRGKTDGGVLLTIDRDGKRDISKTFATAEEASAWAASYIDGQTNARTDAELDQNKSEKIPQQTMTEALFSGEQQDEYERQKKNKAAEMGTQALRERMKKTDAEIRALRRLEKTTGLSETQKSHMEDLQQSLEILNDELKSRKGRAKAKKETVQATGNKPTQSAAEAKNAMMDTFHTAAGQRVELGKQIDRRLAKIAESGKITENDRSEIMDMLMDAGAVREEAAEELKDVRQWLRGARIYVSEHDRADFGDNWNELRRRAWAAGIYLTDNVTDRKADSLNAELAETFGERMFPTDAALSDMLSNLVDKAEAGRSRIIPFAQAIENEARGMRMDPQEIYNELSAKLDETLRTYAEKARLEVELKNRTASQLATERKRMEDRLERQAQRRRESEIRDKTLKALRRLEKLRGKAAGDVRAQIDEALKDIDTQARSLTMSGIEDLQALQQAYEDAKKAAGYIDEENPGNFLRNPYVEEKLARLSKIHLNDMDIADVIELGRVVASLENTVRTQNQMIGEEFDKTIKETADEVDRDVKASKGAKPGFVQKWFKEEQLSPRRFLDMLGGWKKGGAMSKLSDSLEKGQTRMLDFQRRASQSFDPFLSKKENRKWLETASGKKATWSTYGVANGLAMDGSGITGQSIEITPMMKIALYLHSLNEDNLRHIQTGGLVIPNKALYLKGKIQEAYAQGERVKMQPQAVRAIASTLTQQEKTFAGYLQKFFNEQSKAAINEVSLQLDGFERAGVDNYFPIESSRSFLASDVAGEARAQTVEGIGSIANERVHASNPIMLSDATDVLTRQIDKVSRYYGYAIPIRNFQAVNNYVFHEEGNAFAGSIKDTINRKWGAGAENYITKMLEDLQSSGRRSDLMGSALAKLRGNLAGATLMFNPSVAISQAASYPGAAQAVGWDGLAAGLVAGPVDTKLIEKYTPLYWYRNQGNSTQELGDAIKEKGLEQKLPWAMNWIQKMDSFTIRRLWAAAEYRVQKDNPGLKPGSKAEIDAGTDEYYRKVAEVFDRAVYDTQPNYTNMERAQILRSNSDVTKFLTMYKTVPLQYYGMMVEAAGRLQSAMQSGNKTDIAEARRYAVNTFGGLLAANTVYVVMKALGKGFRKKDDDYRDEEGNLTAASAGKQLGKDLMEVYAGSVIGGAEAYSLAEAWISGGQWNGPEMSALEHVEDIVNGIGGVFGAIGDGDSEKAARAVKNAALNIAMAMGVPAKNVETYLLSAVRWASPETAMEYDNLFGGIHKGDLKSMDGNVVGIGANLILRNRTGAAIDRSATDELSRLYGAGFTDAIPTNIPDSFSYGGKEVKVNRGKYSDAWGAVVGDNLEELLTNGDYQGADDKTKQAMIRKLYQYATVQARMDADPEYSAEGNSTYGWTLKADEAVDAGIELPTAIAALTTFSGLKADTENGKTIVSKKAKVFDYINGLDLDSEQKDLLYELAGYEKGLEDAPWHGGSGAASGNTGGSSGSKRTVSTYEAELAKAAADPSYTAPGWTIWTGTAVKAGINAEEAITHYNALAGMKADYDQYGKAITGSKKAKVCDYIDALDLTADQKDVLYLSVYKENSLKYTPWHGYTGGKSGGRKRRGRRGGGRRRRSAAKTTKPVEVGKLASGFDTSIDIRTLFGGGSSGTGKGADISAGTELLDLVNKYYNGNPLAAAMDGGRKARTKVDFKL